MEIFIEPKLVRMGGRYGNGMKLTIISPISILTHMTMKLGVIIRMSIQFLAHRSITKEMLPSLNGWEVIIWERLFTHLQRA